MQAPLVVVVAGPPASGKSTFGMALARALPAALVDKDVLAGPLTAAALQAVGLPRTALDDEWYRRHLRPAVYQTIAETVALIISGGTSVVLVAPYLQEVDDEDWLRTAHQQFACTDVRVVWVCADMESLRSRMTVRAAARDRAKLDDWRRYASTIQGISPQCPHHTIDTSRLTQEETEHAAVTLARSWLPRRGVRT